MPKRPKHGQAHHQQRRPRPAGPSSTRRAAGFTRLVDSSPAKAIGLIAAILTIALVALSLTHRGKGSHYHTPNPASGALTTAALAQQLRQLCAVRQDVAKSFNASYDNGSKTGDRRAAGRFLTDLRQFDAAVGRLQADPDRQALLARVVRYEHAYASDVATALSDQLHGQDAATAFGIATVDFNAAAQGYASLGAPTCASRDELTALQVVVDLKHLAAQGIDVRDFGESLLAWTDCPRYPSPSQGALTEAQVTTTIKFIGTAAARSPTGQHVIVISVPTADTPKPWSGGIGRVTRAAEADLLMRRLSLCGDRPLADELSSASHVEYPLRPVSGPLRDQALAWVELRARREQDLNAALRAVDSLNRAMRLGRAGGEDLASRAQFFWTKLYLEAWSDVSRFSSGDIRARAARFKSVVNTLCEAITNIHSTFFAVRHATTADYNQYVAQYNAALRALDDEDNASRAFAHTVLS